MVSCPLLTPPTFLWPLSEAFAAKGEGVRICLVLQGFMLYRNLAGSVDFLYFL